DLAVVPGANSHSWLALALGARWIVGHAGDRPAYKSWPVDELIPYPAAPASWGDLVAQLIEGPPAAPYNPSDWPAPDFPPFDLPAGSYAVLHVGASTPLKLWDPVRWRELAARLAALGLRIAWSAGPGERHIVESIDAQGRYASYAGVLDLSQMWRLIAGAK